MTERSETADKSIEEIENIYWKDQKEYISSLVEECHALRKVKLKDLQIRQMITLLIQDIGSEILMPVVLDKMRLNILEEDEEDGSCFLNSLEFFSHAIWNKNPEHYHALMRILHEKKADIENSWGLKKQERLLRKMEGMNKQQN